MDIPQNIQCVVRFDSSETGRIVAMMRHRIVSTSTFAYDAHSKEIIRDRTMALCITHLMVLSDFQNRGLGKTLMKYARCNLLTEKIDFMFVNPIPGSHKFYQSIGMLGNKYGDIEESAYLYHIRPANNTGSE